ncbi:MAG: chloride channel protein [Gloeomargaritaceae cyanobacterium C42_A2020_066]|nr:chloride channel protein [Gloeomargaritaceae cyanobacterium C42_A2020_066]
MGLVQIPYQWISELGFRLQRRFWPLDGLGEATAITPLAVALVFGCTLAMVWLAWGSLAAGRGGGTSGALALQQCEADAQDRLTPTLSLTGQLRRLLLLFLTHLGGMAVGTESPSASLGASVLLALRSRVPLLQRFSVPLTVTIGAGAGLGAAFRSPLLGLAYGLEELSKNQGRSLVLPTLVIAGVGTLVSSPLGQPARQTGLVLGPLPPSLWGYALLLTLIAVPIGAGFVRVLISVVAQLQGFLKQHRLVTALGVALVLTLVALASGGVSLNDGGLSLGATLKGHSGGPWTAIPWRFLSSVLSIAAGAPGGLMHDTMTLGALLTSPLQTYFPDLQANDLAQLAAVAAAALFGAANGTPLFCGVFVFTLQGDAALLPAILLASAAASVLAEPLRGEEWGAWQAERLLRATEAKVVCSNTGGVG